MEKYSKSKQTKYLGFVKLVFDELNEMSVLKIGKHIQSASKSEKLLLRSNIFKRKKTVFKTMEPIFYVEKIAQKIKAS